MSSKLILTFRRTLRKSIRLYCSASQTSENVSHDEIEKAKMDPFMKSVLLGKFDKRVLVFPEILTNERLKDLENKYLALESREDKIDVQAIGEVTLPVSQFAMDEEVQLTCSETSRIAEAVDSPSLSLTLDISENIIPNIISKFGSQEQITKYVTKLKRGTLVGAYAFCEEVTGSDLPLITCLAEKRQGSWTITGKKIWVTNGDKADVLLVLAKVQLEEDAPDHGTLGAFLVDRESGFKVEEIKKIRQDISVANVLLDGVQGSLVGEYNDGYNIGREVFTTYKYFLAGCCSNLLKKFVAAAVDFVKPRKQLVAPLRDREIILARLGRAAATTYALDSMMYLMAGLRDGYDVDTETEAVLIHAFLIDHGIAAFDKCLSIMGSSAVDSTTDLRILRDDFWTAVQSFFSPDIVRQFAALYSIDYAANILKEDILKSRRSFNFPVFYIRRMLKNARHSRDKPKLDLQLYEELHPSLRGSSEELEYCVLKCGFAVETLMARHGADLVNRQLDLNRLTTSLINIFAMTACLSRASRSYCTGIMFCDDEMTACTSFCRSAFLQTQKLLQEILDGAIMSNDLPHIEFGQQVIHRGRYFLEHPLVKNIE